MSKKTTKKSPKPKRRTAPGFIELTVMPRGIKEAFNLAHVFSVSSGGHIVVAGREIDVAESYDEIWDLIDEATASIDDLL